MLWIGKALTQLLLASIPYGESINYRLQQKGAMRTPEHFNHRIDWALDFLSSTRAHMQVTGKVIVEIGTGWDALHTLLLAALGAREIISFDHVAHLRHHEALEVVGALRARVDELAAISGVAPALIAARLDRYALARDLDAMLAAANIHYRAPADAGRTALPAGSIDVVYSFLVLACVAEPDVASMARETRRILRPGGLAVHHIRMADPYSPMKGGDEVDYLKYSDEWWSFLCDNDIQRNNRLRAAQFLALLTESGGSVVWSRVECKPENVERVRHMTPAARFAGMTPDELAVTALSVVARYDDAAVDLADGTARDTSGRQDNGIMVHARSHRHQPSSRAAQ